MKEIPLEAMSYIDRTWKDLDDGSISQGIEAAYGISVSPGQIRKYRLGKPEPLIRQEDIDRKRLTRVAKIGLAIAAGAVAAVAYFTNAFGEETKPEEGERQEEKAPPIKLELGRYFRFGEEYVIRREREIISALNGRVFENFGRTYMGPVFPSEVDDIIGKYKGTILEVDIDFGPIKALLPLEIPTLGEYLEITTHSYSIRLAHTSGMLVDSLDFVEVSKK